MAGGIENLLQLQSRIMQIPSHVWFAIVALSSVCLLLSFGVYYFADKSFYYVRERFPKKLPHYAYIEAAGKKRKNPFTYVWSFMLGKYAFDSTLKKWLKYGRLFFAIDMVLGIIIIFALLSILGLF